MDSQKVRNIIRKDRASVLINSAAAHAFQTKKLVEQAWNQLRPIEGQDDGNTTLFDARNLLGSMVTDLSALAHRIAAEVDDSITLSDIEE